MYVVVDRRSGERLAEGPEDCLAYFSQRPPYPDPNVVLLDASGTEVQVKPMKAILAQSLKRLMVIAMGDRDLLMVLRQQLNLDGRSLSSNGIRYFPTQMPVEAAKIKIIERALRVSGWQVESDTVFRSAEGPGRTLVMRHPDPNREYNVLTMTTEFQCVALSSATPSVFDL